MLSSPQRTTQLALIKGKIFSCAHSMNPPVPGIYSFPASPPLLIRMRARNLRSSSEPSTAPHGDTNLHKSLTAPSRLLAVPEAAAHAASSVAVSASAQPISHALSSEASNDAEVEVEVEGGSRRRGSVHSPFKTSSSATGNSVKSVRSFCSTASTVTSGSSLRSSSISSAASGGSASSEMSGSASTVVKGNVDVVAAAGTGNKKLVKELLPSFVTKDPEVSQHAPLSWLFYNSPAAVLG